MLSEEDDVDIHALKRQGMTISEIARRTDHDRKTIRAYLAGQRTPGVRRRAAPDPFDAFVDYVTPAVVDNVRDRVPLRWAVRSPLRSNGAAPMNAVAPASISS